MSLIKRVIFSIVIFIGGWLFNFVFDIQFALGVFAGWLVHEGYDNVAGYLINILK